MRPPPNGPNCAWSRLARLHSCLRLLRGGAPPAWAAVAADSGFYDQSHLVNEFRALCGLTPTEFRLLEYLMRNSDQVVTRRMLCEHLWEADWEGVTNVIEVHINRLRTKIDPDGSLAPITTLRGSGYRWDLPRS